MEAIALPDIAVYPTAIRRNLSNAILERGDLMAPKFTITPGIERFLCKLGGGFGKLTWVRALKERLSPTRENVATDKEVLETRVGDFTIEFDHEEIKITHLIPKIYPLRIACRICRYNFDVRTPTTFDFALTKHDWDTFHMPSYDGSSSGRPNRFVQAYQELAHLGDGKAILRATHYLLEVDGGEYRLYDTKNAVIFDMRVASEEQPRPGGQTVQITGMRLLVTHEPPAMMM